MFFCVVFIKLIFPLSAGDFYLGTVLIINLLGKGLTRMACMEDGGYIR